MFNSHYHWLIWVMRAAVVAVLIVVPTTTFAQSSRQKISWCWQHGAVNTPAMQLCSGLFVDTPTFNSCMNNGPCFEDGPFQASVGDRAPFCGAIGHVFCPAPSPCGFLNTIACPYQCGAMGFPPCAQPQPCGMPTTFQCQQDVDQPQLPATFDVFTPTLQVGIPQIPGADLSLGSGIHFAAPPLPDEDQLRRCIQQSGGGGQDFYRCVTDQALPDEYRITIECVDNNRSDPGRALVCSSGREDLMDAYDRYKEVQKCSAASRNNWEVANCIGQQVLGPDEQYYLSCVTRNQGDYKTAAVCALAKDLTPEQQIALSCAISTGGQPYAFAACTGGQLLTRELDKCWQNGIGTANGCFGPNNEYVRFINGIDDQARNLMGENSEAYRAWKFWQNNVLTPGPNHEVIRFLNNGISDLRDGPGPNNEIVRFGNALGDAVQSVGSILGF
jgi:hypothetical protein